MTTTDPNTSSQTQQFKPVSPKAQDQLQRQAQQIRREEEEYLNSQVQRNEGSYQSTQPSQTASSSQVSPLQRQPTLQSQYGR